MTTKYINEEGRAFGLLSAIDQEYIKRHPEAEHFDGYHWHKEKSTFSWLDGRVYRAPAPPEPESLRPVDIVGWYALCDEKVHLITSAYFDGCWGVSLGNTLYYIHDIKEAPEYKFSEDPRKPLSDWEILEEVAKRLNRRVV